MQSLAPTESMRYIRFKNRNGNLCCYARRSLNELLGERAIRNVEAPVDSRHNLLRFCFVKACTETNGSPSIIKDNHSASNSPQLKTG